MDPLVYNYGMVYFSRIFFVFLLLVLSVNCTKKEPFTLPLKETQIETGHRYVMNADKLAKEAQYKSSNYFLEKAIDIYTKIEKWENTIKCYIRIGENFQRMENYDKAGENLNRALELTMNQPGYRDLELAKSFQKMGYKYLSSGEFNRALDMYNKSLLIRIRILGEHNIEVAKTYNSIALAYWNKGDSEKARENYKKSFAIKTHHFPGINFNVKFRFLDKEDIRRVEFSKARNYFKRSLAAYQDTFESNNPIFASIYDKIGILYAFESNYDRSLEFLRKSFDLRLEIYGDNSPEIAKSCLNIGICLRLKGEDEEAMRFMATALEIKQNIIGKDHPDTADIYYQVGKIHFKYNRFAEALSFYQNALIAIAPDFISSSIYINPNPARIYLKERLLKILTAKAEALKMSYMHKPTRIKDIHFALKTYMLIADLINEMRRGYKSESYKLFFGEKSHKIYNDAIRTAVILDEISGAPEYKEMAFSLSEKSKAAVLEEALTESRARRFAGIPDKLLEKEKKLKRELNLYDTLKEKEYEVKGDYHGQRIKNLENRYFMLKAEYMDLIEYFEKNYEKYYNLKYNPHTTTISELQQVLDRDTAFIEYFTGEEMMTVFIITSDKLDVVSNYLNKDFYSDIEAYYLSIKKIDVNKFLNLNRELYRILMEPIWNHIKLKKKLIIIPHGHLYYVPFESLATGAIDVENLSAFDYMIKHFAFSYHYSASLWLNAVTDKEENREKSFVGFAPVFLEKKQEGYNADKSRDIEIEGMRFSQLPGTEKEVRSIIDLFKSKHKEAVGYFHLQASEDRFKSDDMRNYAFVHLATHSLKKENNPKLSGFLFSQVNSPSIREDGILYSGETYNLNMNAELIVLSSCETGIGKLVKGEGMISLNRGFLYAGVRNTIFSLWKVEDETTSILMIELYRDILKGESFATALRKAKLQLIGNRFTAFPRYWSGFILVGE